VTTMTKEKELAMAERALFEAAPAADRSGLKRGIGDFIRVKRPGTSAASAAHRSRLLLAGERADLLWERVDQGMPLSTACRILHEAQVEHLEAGKEGDIQAVVKKCLARYDSEGILHVVNGKAFRVTHAKGRAARIAKGRARQKGRRGGGDKHLKGDVRDAVAAWLAARLPKDDERVEGWVEECMKEVEVVLDSFTRRFTWPAPKRSKIFAACDLLNVARPRWGSRADQERAWKHRKAALRKLHPDTVGHDGEKEAFQAINDAYQTVVAYNDSLVKPDGPKPRRKKAQADAGGMEAGGTMVGDDKDDSSKGDGEDGSAQ